MADRFVASHIRRLPMFAKLTEDQLAIFSDAFRVTRHEAGEVLFQQGQAAQGMYMFITGRGVLLQHSGGGYRELGVVLPNQYINEAALFRESVEMATLQIVETAIVLFLARPAFLSLTTRYPEIYASLQLPAGIQPAAPPIQQQPLPAITQPAPIQSAPRTPPIQQQYPVVPQVTTYKPPPAQPQQTAPPPAPQVYFAGQRDGEQVMFVTRRHWWAYLRRVWLPLLVAAVLFIGAAVMPSPELRLTVLALTVVLPGGVMMYFYLEWRNDMLIVTADRVVHIERTLLSFNSVRIELPIKNIQAINAEIPKIDPFARVFGYGELVIKTSGREGTIRINFLPNPEGIQDSIFERISIGRGVTPEPAGTSASQITGGGGLQTKFINARGETVYRKHLLLWFNGVFGPLLLILGSIVLLILSGVSPAVQSWGIIVLPGGIFLLLVGGVTFYLADWDWRNDLYIIGNDTITVIHRRPLWIQNEDDRIIISRIDNVSFEIKGLRQSLFNFGDVKLSLIGDSGTKVFKSVPDPRTVQDEIIQRMGRVRQAAAEAEQRRRQEEIAGYIAAYDQAKQQGQYPAQGSAPQYGTGIPNSRPNPRQRG